MRTFCYRIFDKFRQNVVSLALLTDDNPSFRPSEYRRGQWRFEVLCRFPIVKLIDYREHWTDLEANPNPFAIIVRAYLKALETVGNVQEKYSWKKRFILELYNLGMKRETLLVIYKFIDWMMKLPVEQENKLYNETKAIEEAKAMSLMTTAERIGYEQGIESTIKSMQRVVTKIIESKFGEFGGQLVKRSQSVKNLEALENLSEKLLNAQSISEAEKIFDEIQFSQ